MYKSSRLSEMVRVHPLRIMNALSKCHGLTLPITFEYLLSTGGHFDLVVLEMGHHKNY